MHKLKQGTAAIALVATLGLVVPSTFGGSASADISDHDQDPYVDTTFTCDLDGDGYIEETTDGVVVHGYDDTFELVSTEKALVWQDTNSNTVIGQRLRVDVLDSFYEVLDDPSGTAENVADPDVYWFNGPQVYSQGGGKPKGWQTVRCTEVISYEYTANFDDEQLGLGFVEDVLYLETDTNLYDVTISHARSGAVKAASADDGKHKAKNGGKHRSKSKHRK
jgi:hypothetical protein